MLIADSYSTSNYSAKDAMFLQCSPRFEKAVSKLLISDGLENCLDAGSEVTTIWQLLNNTSEARRRSTGRQDILDQMLDNISIMLVFDM